jgi:putative hemolysin
MPMDVPETVDAESVDLHNEPATLPPVPSAAHDLRAGLPGYEILEEVGRGGMGVVYKARHLALKRVVALKMILGGTYADEASRERFRAEAEIIARLNHPNIVQVYECGEQSGIPFFSLEFCDGGSLDRKLGGTPLPPSRAARLLAVLARAVEAAHARGLVHRDLKPGNILLQSPPALGGGHAAARGQDVGQLRPAARGWIPKVSDFGLAKDMDVSARTATGAILGTPSYMAPEQAASERRKIGPKADVYALGAILYECLTGRPPFKGPTPLDTVLQVMSDEPVPPSQLQSRIPRDLETICLKCLLKEPAKRYGSAGALAEDLERFLRGEAVRARPLGPAARAWRWCKRNPAMVGAVATLFLIMAIGVAVTVLFTVQENFRARDLALARQEASRQAGVATEARQEADLQALAAKAAADRVQRAERDADAASRRSDDLRRRADGQVYARRIASAQLEWRSGDQARANAYLEECDLHLRGWEHSYLGRLFRNGSQKLSPLQGHTGEVRSVCFSPDGKHLASGGDDGRVLLWDARTGQKPVALLGHSREVYSVCFRSDGKRLASGSWDGNVKVWDPQTSRELLSFKAHEAGLMGVCFSPDGKRLASCGADYTIRLWDPDAETPSTRALLPPLQHSNRVTSICFNADGTRLASAGDDHAVQLWDTGRHKVIRSFVGHSNRVSSVCFAADGKRLATAGEDRTIRIWDVESANEILRLAVREGRATSLCFSPDGKRLVSGSSDAKISVWDAELGEELLVLKGHSARVSSICFSPDGRRLASGSWDKTVRVWDGGQE